jgi:myo-inositol-1(or 4)-monophosphatase
MKVSSNTLRKCLREATDAGAKVLVRKSACRRVTALNGDSSLVLAADILAENAIIRVIRKYFPHHGIQSEEAGTIHPNLEARWIVDPLDGTVNYAMGRPNFSVSIAFERNGTVAMGAVLCPATRQYYFAEKGCGAYCNGRALRVTRPIPLSDSLIVCDWGQEGPFTVEGLQYLARLTQRVCRGVNISFNPSFDLCHVAEGKVDIFLSNGTQIEDHAAASLIVTEAGGIVEGWMGKDWSHTQRGIIGGSSARIISELRERLRITPGIARKQQTTL